MTTQNPLSLSKVPNYITAMLAIGAGASAGRLSGEMKTKALPSSKDAMEPAAPASAHLTRHLTQSQTAPTPRPTNQNAPGLGPILDESGTSIIKPLPESCQYRPNIPESFTYGNGYTAPVSYQPPDHPLSLYGASGEPYFSDVQQTGALGDCWLMASMASLVGSGYKQLIKNRIALDENGCVSVHLGSLVYNTKPEFPVIDGSFQTQLGAYMPWTSAGRIGWAALFEKAMVASTAGTFGGATGGYSAINGNDPAKALSDITGIYGNTVAQTNGVWPNDWLTTVLNTPAWPTVLGTPDYASLPQLGGQFSAQTNQTRFDSQTTLTYSEATGTPTLTYSSPAYTQAFIGDHAYSVIRQDYDGIVAPSAQQIVARNPWNSNPGGSGGPGEEGLLVVPYDVASRVFIQVSYILYTDALAQANQP